MMHSPVASCKPFDLAPDLEWMPMLLNLTYLTEDTSQPLYTKY